MLLLRQRYKKKQSQANLSMSAELAEIYGYLLQSMSFSPLVTFSYQHCLLDHSRLSRESNSAVTLEMTKKYIVSKNPHNISFSLPALLFLPHPFLFVHSFILTLLGMPAPPQMIRESVLRMQIKLFLRKNCPLLCQKLKVCDVPPPLLARLC